MDTRSSIRRTNTTRTSIFSINETPAIKILKRNEITSGKLTGVVFCSNTLPHYLLFGGILSSILCFLILLSYIQIVPWRKHPSPLILYRSLSHFIFSIVIIFNSFEKKFEDSASCHLLSFLTQFTFFTGESWLLTIAVDLYLSLTNPFTSYTSNLTKYHFVVWITGGLNAFSLVSSNYCQGVFADRVCWIDVQNIESPCLWGYYLSWIVMFYMICIAVIIFAVYRISKGLESTYESRKACVNNTFIVVITYILYSVICLLLYVVVLAQDDNETPFTKQMKNTVAYLLALRGFVDAVLWFNLRDFRGIKSKSLTALRNETSQQNRLTSNFITKLCSYVSSAMSTPLVPDTNQNRPSIGVFSDSGQSRDQSRTNMQDEISSTSRLSVEEDFGIDIDLSPQLNLALREEVLHLTTVGIIKSVELSAIPYPSITRSFTLENNHLFTDYQPRIFRTLREINGIGEEWYMTQISHTAKERLAEGGSGAFMFFCGSGEFVVKTVKSNEADTLLEILPHYVNHLQQTPQSLLVRFLGLHSLKMYNQLFHFVVMKNIFPSSAIINTRYDIKGSWINRNGGFVPPGKKTFCRHCSELFISGTSAPCPDIVGVHEPNFILKDNDLTTKIRLRPEDAYYMIETLNKDSDALCAMGITDYSMLVGVRNLQYNVDPEKVISKSRTSNAVFSRDSLESYTVAWNGTSQSTSQNDEISVSSLPYPHGNSDLQAGIILSAINDPNIMRPIPTITPTSPNSRLSEPPTSPFESSLSTDFPVSRLPPVIKNPLVKNSSHGIETTIRNPPQVISYDNNRGITNNNNSNNNTNNNNNNNNTLENIPKQAHFQSIPPSLPPVSSLSQHQRERIDGESNMFEITEEEMTGGYLARTVIAPGVYYIGIVDILQKWTWEKRLEWFFKVYILRQSSNGISCMPPEPYRSRFQFKISQIFEHSIFIREITGSWVGKREITSPAPLIDT